MRKLWIFAILFTVILAGCGANPVGIESVEMNDNEVITTIRTNVTAITSTTISAASTTIASLTLSTTSKPTANIRQTAIRTEATTKVNIEKEIPLDVKIDNPFGEMAIYKTRIWINSQHVTISFYYKLISAERIYPITASIIDKNKNEYSMLNFGATPSKTLKNENGKTIGYEYNDTIGTYREINDNIDLSTVTLTYAFEGYDPVTVTFDIPGL